MPPLFVIRKGVECFLHAYNLGKSMALESLHIKRAALKGCKIKCKMLEHRRMQLRLCIGALRARFGDGFVAKQIADKTIQCVLAAWSGVRGMWCHASVAQLDRASDF